MEDKYLGGYTQPWLDSIIENRRLIKEYNNTLPTQLTERYDILKRLLGEVHDDTLIEPPFRCDDGKNIFIGKHFYANYNLVILDHDKVIMGDNVLIGPNVTISSASHSTDWRERTVDGETTIWGAPVVIEDDVWIGAGCIILPGVTIGRHSVIGAGSVVTKDIPADCMAAGSPAKVIKFLDK